jgi:hypothetical protein
MAGWHIASKLERQRIMARKRALRPYLIKTGKFGRLRLRKYLKRYKTVFVKPVYGRGGRGIIKVSKRGARSYRLQKGSRARMFRSKRRVAGEVKKLTRGKPYLVQRGIRLLTLGGRPIDFRIFMLKPGHKWVCMGIMGRWAAPGRVVTNYSAGGKALSLSGALKASRGLSHSRIRHIERKLIRIGHQVAKAFSGRYRHVRKLGIDVALDRRLRIWILEPNTDPGYNLFRHHKDRTRFGQIRRMSRHIRHAYYKR